VAGFKSWRLRQARAGGISDVPLTTSSLREGLGALAVARRRSHGPLSPIDSHALAGAPARLSNTGGQPAKNRRGHAVRERERDHAQPAFSRVADRAACGGSLSAKQQGCPPARRDGVQNARWRFTSRQCPRPGLTKKPPPKPRPWRSGLQIPPEPRQRRPPAGCFGLVRRPRCGCPARRPCRW
jgi:hypothetical protein